MTNLDRLENFINVHKLDENDCQSDCATQLNDLSMCYRKKLDICHDVIRGKFSIKPETELDEQGNALDNFIFTHYNQTYAYYRIYHQLGDVDTRNISIYPLGGVNLWRAKLLELALFQHLNTINYRSFVDKESRLASGYGNTVAKIVDGVPYLVNLLNVLFDNRMGDIQKSSIVEYFTLPYHEAIKKFPKFKKEIDEIYDLIQEDGYNEIKFIEFWSWFDFNGKIKKGVATYLLADPDDYTTSTRLREYVTKRLKEGLVWVSKTEIAVEESKCYKYDVDGKVIDQLFPYVVGECFPLDDEIRSQGVIEILLPLQVRFNQLMERLDRLINGSLSGTKIHEIAIGTESNYTNRNLQTMKSDSVITLVKDQEDLRPIIDQSISVEANALLNHIALIKKMMNEITGVTDFALSADINQSAKATTSNLISAGTQTPFRSFKQRRAEVHSAILGDFILPYLIEKQIKSGDEIVLDMPVKVKNEIVREAAASEVNRNWEKFNNKVWEESKKMFKFNPESAPRIATKEDYENEIERLVEKSMNNPVKFAFGDWVKKLKAKVTIDIDNELADKERKFARLMELASIPFVQSVLDAEEVVNELLRNSGVDNYNFVKTKFEQMQDRKQAAEEEIYKNVVAQNIASQYGDFGVEGGRPMQENRIKGQGIQLNQPIMS